jgi:hypothetical protein
LLLLLVFLSTSASTTGGVCVLAAPAGPFLGAYSSVPFKGPAADVYVMQEVFARQLRQLDPFRELGDEDVRTAIKNSSGVAGAVAVSLLPSLLLAASVAVFCGPYAFKFATVGEC